MKKIQIQTAEIKANAQVIVLDASFVARVADAHNRLNTTVKNMKERANEVLQGYRRCIARDSQGHNVAVEMIVDFADINRMDVAKKLLDDIMFAFVEDEDGTAPAIEKDYTFEGAEYPEDEDEEEPRPTIKR